MRYLTQLEGDRIRLTLRNAGLPVPVDNSLRVDGNRLRYALKQNAFIGNDTIKALLEAGVAAKTDPIEMSVAEALKTKENAATDRPDGRGGCDVWIELADPKAPLFRGT